MSKLLKTRRGHDSEDDYSDADTDISADIDDDESIHSISEVDQSDFDYKDDESDLEESESDYDETEEEVGEEQDPKGKGKAVDGEGQNANTEQHNFKVSNETVTQDNVQINSTETAEENTPIQVEEIDYEATKEKRIQEHREYRRKLAEDPSFVPYVGLFWSHDDRYRDDAFSETRAAPGSASSEIHFNPSLKNGANTDRSMDPLMYKKWDHSGYEELLRLEEQEERLKRMAIENGQEYDNTAEHGKYIQRGGRGRYNGRGGPHNQGQRYQNFNNYHRNRNYQQNRQPKPTEEWPQLSDSTKDKETPTIVENHSWATATPELLQSHDNGPATGNLIDVTTTTTPESKHSEVAKDVAIVNAWGSIDRVEESETLNQDSIERSKEAETKTPSEENGWGESDSAAVGWGAEPAQPSSDGWSNQDPVQSASNKEGKESAPSEKNNWTDTSSTNVHDSQTNTTQQNAPSGWAEATETTETSKERNEDKGKEHVPDQFLDAESQVGSPKLSNTEKISIPTEEKASNSWAELSANAEPEKTYSNTYRRPRNNFSPNERSFTSHGRNNYEDNNRGFRKYNDRGYSKQQYNSRSPVTQSAQQEDSSWNSTIGNKGWAKTAPTSQETSGGSWGVVDNTAAQETNGWGETSTEAVNITSQWNVETNQESTVGWNTSTEISEKASSSGWDQTPTAAQTPRRYTSTESAKPAETDTTGWNAQSTTTPASTETMGSSWTSPPTDEAKNNAMGWNSSPAPTETSNSGWGNSSAPVESGWGTSSTKPETSFESGESPAVVESPSRWGHNNDYTSKPRQNGWSNSQSSSSSNWNADKKARMNKQTKEQPRRGRGYLSQKLETTPPIDNPPVSVTEEYQIHGDSDSDVEIILEADEEPDWVKNEQILGMTAPGEEQPPVIIAEESPRIRETYTRNYDSSSPQPESSYRNMSRNYNNQRKPRRNFDENWRQRDEVSSDGENRPTNAVPMYYPQPHHHINTGNITYLPMIPNGPNGSPVYAMPFPMGVPSPSPIAGSTSPNNSVGGSDSSPHINNSNIKFYPPMMNGPNGLQLPPGYEANGMVYYGMDPSSMYGPPQPFYYYGPPVPGNGPPMIPAQQRLSPNDLQIEDDAAEDGWGPPPDVDDSEEQWNNRKASPSGNYHNSSAYYIYHQ